MSGDSSTGFRSWCPQGRGSSSLPARTSLTCSLGRYWPSVRSSLRVITYFGLQSKVPGFVGFHAYERSMPYLGEHVAV